MRILDLEKHNNFKFQDDKKIVRFVWSAILDDKVCDLCRSLDGKVMDANGPEYSIYKSPIHPRCRCTQIPITSDAEIIPKPNFEKPKDSWIIQYAPFWFLLPFKGKKEEPIEIAPFAPESPELIFDPKDIFSIEKYIEETEYMNIENAVKEIEAKEEERKPKIIWIIYFVDKMGRILVEKEIETDEEIVFSHGEIKAIKEKATKYLISPGNYLVEDQIKKLFNLKKKEI